MPETTISHGILARLYEKLERLAKAEGMTPDELAAKLGAERFFEKTRPKGAGKIRNLPVAKRAPAKNSTGPEKGEGGTDEGPE
ncbi:hypothetical protein [Pseudomonas coleopterorum]|uniref:hypothetical protein n=1 Tax=Pseudomonas coleopterorum TaxID=1605838 RepID=UPI0008987B14|nr:hypothetical protein [Pseudomonas coleopterorum]SEE39648.1 hypothetical protein SAMN05216510_2457 [Pseudomonas coleopterorum]